MSSCLSIVGYGVKAYVADWDDGVSVSCAGNGWPHNALWHH